MEIESQSQLKTIKMEKMTKTEKNILKALEVGRMVMMTAFAGVFGFLALVAFVCLCRDFNLFNLLGVGAATIVARLLWDMRRDW